MDKLRSNQRAEKEDTIKTVNISRSILSDSLSGKSTKIEKPLEIDISKDSSSLSGMSGHVESLSSVTPDQERIPRKNKINKTSYTLITVKESIQEPYNPSKRAKEDSIPDVEKISPKKTPPPFKNK